MSDISCYLQTSFDLFSPDPALFTDVPVSDVSKPEVNAENTLPLADKTDGYAVYIFTKDIPDRQISRCYYIVYQPSLWDHYTVQRQWGVAGSPNQQFCTEHFRTPSPALARIRRLITRRLRRGYRLSYAA